MRKLKQELGPSASPSTLAKINTLEVEKDPDAQFATALKTAGNVVLGHIFLRPEAAKSADPKLAEEYFNIIWAKAFPQVLKVQSKNQNFDLGRAWIENGGSVAAGV